MRGSTHPAACESCGSTLIQVVNWAHLSDDCYQLDYSCPECYCYHSKYLNLERAEEFNQFRKDAFKYQEELASDLSHERFENDVEAFIAAIYEGHVLPFDLRP